MITKHRGTHDQESSPPAGASTAAEREIADPMAVADDLAETFARTAVERDKEGGTARRERDLLRASGLLTLTIPRQYGGQGATWAETLRVVRRLARVDGSLAHLFGFHHLLLATVRLFGAPEQWTRLFTNTAECAWFWGNALNPLDTRTTITPPPFAGGDHVIDGHKSFCSGAADSNMLVVSALNGDKRLVVAALPSDREGIQIAADWDNMGQRQTDSGSVTFHAVRVHVSELLTTPGPLGSVFASLRPCIAQLVLANVYLGLGLGAFDEGVAWTRAQGKPWYTSGVPSATDDPYVLQRAGELFVALEGARALTDLATGALDQAWSRTDDLTAAERGATAVAIATAKIASTRAGLDVANRIFELTGARATTARAGLDRFWRNLRTHTLHDPVDYKLRELGRFTLAGELPVPSFYS